MKARLSLVAVTLGSSVTVGCILGSNGAPDGGRRDVATRPVGQDAAVADGGAQAPVCIPAERVVTSLASGLQNPGAIAVNDKGIFVQSGDSLFVLRQASELAIILTTGMVGFGGLAADGSRIYWTSWATMDPSADPSLDRIMALPITGGEAVVLAAGTHRPQDVAVDSTHAYWTAGGASDGVVMSLPLAGGTPATLASGQVFPGAITVDPDFVYWVNGTTTLSPPQAKAALMRIAKSGGNPVTLATAPVTALSARIVVDATSVYWSLTGFDASTLVGTITRVPLDGSAPIVLASGQNWPGDIAVDSEAVYWANGGECMGSKGSIMKLPFAGGAPVALACDQFCPMGLAADATHVYWTDAYLGGVFATTKD